MSRQIKLCYWLFGLSVLCILLHNAFCYLFKVEEPVFFILTFVFILGFVIQIIYSVYTYVKIGQPKDLWKLGWLGLAGLVGLHPKFGVGFYGFYGFFGFFGAKGWRKK